jgi:hypothetical protein
MEKLIRAKEALLAVKGDNASVAEIGSEISSLDNEIESLFNISSVLGEKVNKSVPSCYLDGLPHDPINQ